MSSIKKISIFAFMVVTATNLTHADIHIKKSVYTNAVYDIGTVFPAETTEKELWVGNQQSTLITPDIIIIIDENKDLVSILNRKAKTYVESPLPLDLLKIIPQDLFLKIQAYQISGVVKKTGEVKKVKQKHCNLYEIIMEFPYPKEIKIWTSVDMPFNWTDVRELQSTVWKLNNYTADFIRMLDTIEGYWMLSQESMWMEQRRKRNAKFSKSLREIQRMMYIPYPKDIKK